MNCNKLRIRLSMTFATLALAISLSGEATPHRTHCRMLAFSGEVNAGQEWRATIGEGWVFRVLPVQPAKDAQVPAYSGWDLVVDRDQPAGFPDALLLATPPYNSISEREVGNTFGLRAQDAIGWNPRSFRFLSTPAALREGRQLYSVLVRDGQIHAPSSSHPGANADAARAMRRLLELESHALAGQFRILDARLAPGIADA